MFKRCAKWSVEFILAGVIFMGLLAATPTFLEWSRSDAQAFDWFQVNQLYVEDFVVGQEPIFAYDRTIKKPFNADWTASVELLNEKELNTICQGRGSSEYLPQDTLPPLVDINWFVGANCVLIPGQYRITANWTLHVENYPTMEYVAVSNVFTVLPKLPTLK